VGDRGRAVPRPHGLTARARLRAVAVVALGAVLVGALGGCGDGDDDGAGPPGGPPTAPGATAAAPTSGSAAPTTTTGVTGAPDPSSTAATVVPTTGAPGPAAVLVLTRTAGFRHSSIEPAVAALQAAAPTVDLALTVDPDTALVTDDGLAPFDAVVLLSTTGDWLADDQQAALERWAATGGGVAAVHAATDAEPDWPFLMTLLGTRFAGHPAVQAATVVVEDPAHPATAGLPARWDVLDEWYDFAPDPRAGVHVLASVDETTYEGGGMGPGHPVEWCRDPTPETGRVWYTALGHPDELWADATFVAHVAAGIAWAAGTLPGSCAP
jgi:type 1 glutamine amidotransferase